MSAANVSQCDAVRDSSPVPVFLQDGLCLHPFLPACVSGCVLVLIWTLPPLYRLPVWARSFAGNVVRMPSRVRATCVCDWLRASFRRSVGPLTVSSWAAVSSWFALRRSASRLYQRPARGVMRGDRDLVGSPGLGRRRDPQDLDVDVAARSAEAPRSGPRRAPGGRTKPRFGKVFWDCSFAARSWSLAEGAQGACKPRRGVFGCQAVYVPRKLCFCGDMASEEA